jgi:prolyl-tRNA synthetase
MQLAHTTSWGVSTRMIGGVVMTHGDDDGLRTPPAIAPKQIVIVPMLRDKPEDAQVLNYAQALKAELSEKTAFGVRLRPHVDTSQARSADKRWAWVRRGAPLILEIGPRDAANGQVTFMRRDALRDGDKIKSHAMSREAFVGEAASLLLAIQSNLFTEAKARLHDNILTDLKSFADVAAYFGADEEAGPFRGWARVGWSRPEGAALDAIDAQLKALKLTIRNAPLDQSSRQSTCAFTGGPAVEDILIARAY